MEEKDNHNHGGCSCSDGHSHGEEDPKEILKRIGISVVFLAGAIFVSNEFASVALYILAYAIIGYPVLTHAAKNLIRGKIFDENFLMSIATMGAIFLKDYPEAIGVMLFYQVGEYLQGRAVNNSRRSISDLMALKIDVATVERDNELLVVNPDTVAIGEIILVKPGEKIPLDGIVFSGNSSIDTSALTGESLPRDVENGDEVFAGTINQQGLLKIEVMKLFAQSSASKILQLVEDASSRKSRAERFMTRFARYYTPIVVLIAVLLSVLPPIILGEDFNLWLYRGLIFLVVSCPCALVLSLPLTYFSGLGAASRAGILLKGSTFLDTLVEVDTMIFDKTGTLTTGVLEIVSVEPISTVTREELLYYAAYAEAFSTHPIAKAIRQEYGQEIDSEKIIDLKEFAGRGNKVIVEGNEIILGNLKYLRSENIAMENVEVEKTAVYIAMNNKYIGAIYLADTIKTNAKKAIHQIKVAGVEKTIMLTGDKASIGNVVAKSLGIDQVYGDLLPQDKLSIFEKIKMQTVKKVAVVGDGINDAPMLMSADVGIAMGGLGAEAAIEAADIVIMNDDLEKIVVAQSIAKKTKIIVIQNIILVLLIKIIVLGLSTVGLTTMWAAIFADVGASLLAVFNSLRITYAFSKKG